MQKLQMSELIPVLDSLGLGILALSADGTPCFLTAIGAKILGIENRFNLDNETKNLEPLSELATQPMRTNSSATLSLPRPVLSEVVVHSKDQRRLRLLAYPVTCSLDLPQTPQASLSPGNARNDTKNVQHFVVFYQLDSVLSALNAYQFSKQLRPLVLHSLSTGQVDNTKARNQLSPLAPHGFSDLLPSLTINGATDLARTVSATVALVDRYVPTSLRITTKVDNSALLAIAPLSFLQLCSSLFFEATDFAGPHGKVRLKTTVKATSRRQLRTDQEQAAQEHAAELVFLCQRIERASVDLLDSFFERKLYGPQYRVTVAEEEPTIKQLSSGEKISSGREQRSTTQARNHSLTEESYSENLRFAQALAAEYHIELQVRRPTAHSLLLYIRCPLLTSQVPHSSL